MKPILLWLRHLGTSRLLWLSFGLLTSILAALGIVGIVRLQSITTSFEKYNNAKLRAEAGKELEINLLDYSLSVLRYLNGYDPAQQGAAQDAVDVARHLNAYTELAESARQRELAGRVCAGWQHVHALGEALIAPRANAGESARFTDQIMLLQRLLHAELQPDAENIREALNALTVGNLQKAKIVTLWLLFIGLAIALAASLMVRRAVLAGEAALRDSEERLTRLNATLEQQVAARTQELREINEDLDRLVVQRTGALSDSEKKLRALVEQLTRAQEQERHRLATELHDYLGQLLAVSRMYIGSAERFAVSDPAKNAFVTARQSLDEAITYTRTLMAQLSPQVLYDLGLPAALAWLGDQMEQRHQLRVEVVGDPAGFALDEARAILAFQCARELLWNVVQHGATHEARVTYELKNGELTLEVADQGRGFDLASVEKQAGATEKFGLFSMRQRLEFHHGRMAVESAPGQGTSVKVILPAAIVQAPPKASIEPPALEDVEATAKQPLRIVLVDDVEMVRQGLRWLLEDHADIRVVGEAKDGLEAIAVAQELKPDIIIMDVNMPRMNGIEATRQIVLEQPAVIVIGLSFASDPSVQAAMKNAGAYDCLNKERATEEIYQAIIDAVNREPPGKP